MKAEGEPTPEDRETSEQIEASDTPAPPATDASEGGDAAHDAQSYAYTREVGGWKHRFIEALRVMPNVRAACEMANCSRSGAYNARGIDPQFAADWDTAIEESVDRLEQAAWERATFGTQRIRRTYHKDGKLATETIEEVFSDRLAELLLKAHRPDKYIERLRLGREPDDAELDSEIVGLARELAQLRNTARELQAGPQIDPDNVIEAEVIEPTDDEGGTDG